MSQAHAVICIDHHTAQILRFDAEHVQAQKVKAHDHYTRQHGSAVRTEHEFFAEVCAAVAGSTELLVTGGHTAQADFGNYAEKHRPQVYKQIIGWETVNQPTEAELLALARKYFAKHDRMTGSGALKV